MVAMSGSSTRSLVWLFLIISVVHQSVGEQSQRIVCSQPDSFTVQITENENVVVYDTELLIKYNPHVRIVSLPGIDPVNVIFNQSTIEFKGYMSPEYPLTQSSLSHERFSWTSSGIILGIGTLQKLSSEDYVVQECRLLLPKNITSSTNVPLTVADVIVQYAYSCVKERLCQGLGVKAKELQNININDEFGFNTPLSYAISRDDCPEHNLDDLSVHLNINAPVDIALKNAVKYIKESDQSIITLPDIDETHSVGLGMKCHLQAFNGTFEDLSTLKRTQDAFLSSIGETHVITVGLGLTTAKINYNHYKLKVGFASVSGEILGTVEGIALGARAVIDYDTTCIMNIEYIKVTQLGKIKIHMTGLGPFNNLTSKLVTWLTAKWQNDIVKLIEDNLKDIAEKELSKYLCINHNSQ